jgi:hypothetical protein
VEGDDAVVPGIGHNREPWNTGDESAPHRVSEELDEPTAAGGWRLSAATSLSAGDRIGDRFREMPYNDPLMFVG